MGFAVVTRVIPLSNWNIIDEYLLGDWKNWWWVGNDVVAGGSQINSAQLAASTNSPANLSLFTISPFTLINKPVDGQIEFPANNGLSS